MSNNLLRGNTTIQAFYPSTNLLIDLRFHLIIQVTTLHSTPELPLPPTIHPLSRRRKHSNMLASNLAKFILKRDTSIGQSLTRCSNNTRLAYFNGVKPSPILPLNMTSFEKTAFYAIHTPYRSINSSNGRSLSSTCIRYPADIKYVIFPYFSKALLFRATVGGHKSKRSLKIIIPSP
jgi:hypothetical protein